MGITFAQPLYLLLCLLAIPMAWAGLAWFGGMSRARRWSAIVTRAILLALIACILAGASAVRTVDRMAVIALIDVSGSVRRYVNLTDEHGAVDVFDAIRGFLREASRDRGPDDLLGVVVFDGKAAALLAPTRVDELDRSMDVTLHEGTNIADAIRLGAAMIPPDAAGRLVLFSDGNETAGIATSAASEVSSRVVRAASPSLPIDVVALAYAVADETQIERLDVPPTASADSTIPVRITLASTHGSTGTLRLLREGQPVPVTESGGTSLRLSLPPGRTVVNVGVAIDSGRLHRFEAVYEPDVMQEGPLGVTYAGDRSIENNTAEAFTITPGRGSVLVLDGVSDGATGMPGDILPATLRLAGFEVTSSPPDALPGDLLLLQRYDLVILQNVPVEAIDPRTQAMLVEFVSTMGGGLVMVGGPDSFGAGGWHGSTLEPILPVRLDLPEQLITPEAAIIFVLDSSGSMNRTIMGSVRTQQDLANEAAALAVMSLDARDLVGVIEFNSLTRFIVPLGPNTDPEATASRIRAISAGGGTTIGPALRAAGDALMHVDAKVKHIVVLSDGLATDRDVLPDMARTINAEGITISTIAVGSDADERTMRLMAIEGQGGYYPVMSPQVLPRVFLRAVRVVRSPLLRQTPFDVALLDTGSPLTVGVTSPPRLGGMVLTQAREEPTITYAMLADSGEPILAHWNVGLGQVAAFTSDAHQWASRWLDWPGYATMWTQIARTIARPASTRDVELRTTLDDGRLHVRVEMIDGGGAPIDGANVSASIFSPSGETRTAHLSQTAPGMYEWSGPADETGNYVVIARPMHGGVARPPVIGGVSIASGAEYRALTSNVSLLESVAQITGGRRLTLDAPQSANLYDRTGVTPVQSRTPIWRSLLAWAIVVMLLDVGTRRIAWDRLIGPGLTAKARRLALQRAHGQAARAAETLSALRARKPADSEPTEAPRLDDRDAQALRDEVAKRRYAQMLDSLRASAKAPTRIEPSAATGDDENESRTTDLLAAKRRAAQRFDEHADGDGKSDR